MCKKLAFYVARRSFAQGIRMSFDEALSEVNYRFTLCLQTFDPERGVKFGTYLTRAVQNSRGDVMRTHREDLRSDRALRIDTHSADAGDDGIDGLHEVLADPNAIDPEESAERVERLINMLDRQPLALRMVAAAEYPTEELQRELEAVAAHRRYAQELNIAPAALPSKMNMTMVMAAFRCNWRHKDKIKAMVREGIA